MVYLLENPEGYDERTLARKLLAYGLEQEYGITGAFSIGTAPLGKPYLPEYPHIHFNYSHCRRGILCGISHEEIGVDIEKKIPYSGKLAARICHPNELRMVTESNDRDAMLTAFWTGKESYLKYLGTGIRRDIRKIDLSAAIGRHIPFGEIYIHSILEENYGMCICCEASAVSVRRVYIKQDGFAEIRE